MKSFKRKASGGRPLFSRSVKFALCIIAFVAVFFFITYSGHVSIEESLKTPEKVTSQQSTDPKKQTDAKKQPIEQVPKEDKDKAKDISNTGKNNNIAEPTTTKENNKKKKEGEWDFHEYAKQFPCWRENWCDTFYNDSAYVQQYIYNHQHPADCHKARFLVLPTHHISGLGSSLHIKSFIMTIALMTNRVYIMPDNTHWAFGSLCEPPTFNCAFQPITNCTTIEHLPNWNSAPTIKRVSELTEERVLKMPYNFLYERVEGYQYYAGIAPPFDTWNKDEWWWHAQVAAYVARPSEKTKQILAEEQNRVFPNGVIPHPLMSMYVRHSDKFVEAPLYDFSKYMDVVENFTKQYPGAKIKDIYIGTEDHNVINELSRYPQYNFYYIKTERDNASPFGRINGEKGKEITRVSLADLFIQVQGDVFIGTRSSNYCRLIDEIRKVEGKARIPYLFPEELKQMLREL